MTNTTPRNLVTVAVVKAALDKLDLLDALQQRGFSTDLQRAADVDATEIAARVVTRTGGHFQINGRLVTIESDDDAGVWIVASRDLLRGGRVMRKDVSVSVWDSERSFMRHLKAALNVKGGE